MMEMILTDAAPNLSYAFLRVLVCFTCNFVDLYLFEFGMLIFVRFHPMDAPGSVFREI